MVRVIGRTDALGVYPELVWHPDVASSGRVQAWVVGPGRDTDEDAAEEILRVLETPQPVILDADALTVAARNPRIQAAIRAHGNVILTPHAGECARLYEGTGTQMPAGSLAAAQGLASALGCVVLLKGRKTIIAGAEGIAFAVDAGNSFAATPGSGDVLSGIAGAWLARTHVEVLPELEVRLAVTCALAEAAVIHSHAAALSALTPDGYAPTRASRIVDAIPQAIARLR